MDTPGSGQAVYFFIEDGSIAGAPSVVIGYSQFSSERHVYASVGDIVGGFTAIDAVVPSDGLEHILEFEFTGVGNEYIFYVDGVPVGSHTPSQPSLSAFDYIELGMQTNVPSNVVYASQVEINNCP